MKFLSYAQNYEDVMLWRALGHIPHGFYIDLGAWLPDYDSVTKAFYERGWQGVNVEPNPVLWEQLQQKRTRDTNLQVAVAAVAGTGLLNLVENSGLSTLNDSIAVAHQGAGWASQRVPVQTVRLEDIFRLHVGPDQPVHFLKIDVEGLEEEIVRDFPWSEYRPWVLVIEATKPMSQEASFADWESVLLSSGYAFVYFDGLNRFYVAEEHAELANQFKVPPNYFDQFELAHHAQTRESLERLSLRHAQIEQQLSDANRSVVELTAASQSNAFKLAELEAMRQYLHARVRALETSISWRVTAPLRAIFTWIQTPAAVVKGAMKRVALWGLRQPRLVRSVHAVLRWVPALHRLAMLGMDLLVIGRPRSTHVPVATASTKPVLLLVRPSADLAQFSDQAPGDMDQLMTALKQAADARWDVRTACPDEAGYSVVESSSTNWDISGLHSRDSLLLMLTEAPVQPGHLAQIRQMKAQGVRVAVWVTVPSLARLADQDGAVPPSVTALLGKANALICSSAVAQEWATLALQSPPVTPMPELHVMETLSGVASDAGMVDIVGQLMASLRPLLHEHLVGLDVESDNQTTVDDALARIRQELRVFHHA